MGVVASAMVAALVLSVAPAAQAAGPTSGPGVPPDQIRGLGNATQVVVVTASAWSDTRAVLNAWVRSGGRWHLSIGGVPAYAGYAGFSTHRHEGDGTTPAGVFGFVYAFGSRANPGVSIGWRGLVPHSCWAGTRTSYNRWVTRNPCAGADEDLWASAAGAYREAAVVDYNYAHPVYGAGSGIFVHLALGHPTSGCVSIPESTVIRLLKWLRPGARIAMGPASYLRGR